MRRHAVPVNRRAEYRAIGRQEVLQEQLGVAIGRRRRVAFIAQKTAQVIIEKMQAGGSTGFGGTRQDRLRQRGAVAVAARAADQHHQTLGLMSCIHVMFLGMKWIQPYSRNKCR